MSHISRLPQACSFFILALFLAIAGNIALPGVAKAEIVTSVDDRVKVFFGRVRYDSGDRVFKTWVRVKNVSSADILPPLQLAVTEFKNDRYAIANADGINADGDQYVEIGVPGGVLESGGKSAWALIEIERQQRPHPWWQQHEFDDDDEDDALEAGHGSSDKWKNKADNKNKIRRKNRGGDKHRSGGKGKGKGGTGYKFWKHRNKHRDWRVHLPPFKFDYTIFGGAALATSAPTSTPSALVPGAAPELVTFRANLLGEGVEVPEEVLLKNLDTDETFGMNDDGQSGDQQAGDGIYIVQAFVDATGMAAGDCQTFVSAIMVDGVEIASAPYDLCATNLPQLLVDSDTTPANQVEINGGLAVSNEILIGLLQGFGESALEEFLKQFGGEVVGSSQPRQLYQVRFPGTLSDGELVQILQQANAVAGVSSAGPNYIGTYTTTPSDAMYASQHGLQLISTDDLAAGSPRQVWDANATGGGITVTLLDSGVDAAHPDLAGQVAAEIFAGANTDTLGHGTQMAGIIAAATDNAIGIAGMARDASIESIKVSADANVTQAEMIQGFIDAGSPASTGQIVNASFSIFGPLLPSIGMCGEIDNLIASGLVVVNSAGNDNNSTTGVWPGMCNDPALNALLNAQSSGDIVTNARKPHFIVVGASNCSAGACATDSRKADSNFGGWVDIAAPGVSIPATTIGAAYTNSNGTSAAAALVSGSAAILESCGVTSTQVFSTLDLGATVAVTGDFNRVNVYDSLASLNTVPTAIALSNNLIDENIDTSGGVTIGTLSTTDATACDAHGYMKIGGADAASFTIVGDELRLDDGVLDFETQSSYSVTVESTDFYGGTTSQAFTVNVNDLPEAVITELVACGTDNTNGDFIDRGFFHPTYPGSSIDSVELFIASRQAGDHEIRLDVRANQYGGALIASDTQTRTLSGIDTDNVSYVFDLGNAAVTPGSTVAFELTLVSGPPPGPAGNEVYYAVDSTEHPLGVPDPTPSCDIDETEGTTPPLDTFRRDGVWVRIDGQP